MNQGTGRRLRAPRAGRDAVINAAFYAVGAVVLALILYGLWSVWDTATSPMLTLKKSEWRCTQERVRRVSIIDRYGVENSKSVWCDQYSRVGAPPR